MQTEVVMAGFGGQGLMLIGKLLALAGMDEGKEVSWLPSYGPEMRGGTANCTVVLADRPIGSPLVDSPGAAVVMNRPSMERFAPRVRAGGVLVVNSSLVPDPCERGDLDELRVAATEIAIREGSKRSANMVALGALVGRARPVSAETLEKVLRRAFGSRREVLEVNLRCFRKGLELAAEKEKCA